MTKKTGLAAQLDKLEQDKKALERRAKQLKEGAALKLGKAVAEAGGLELDPRALKAFMKLVMDHGGLDEAAAQLKAAPRSDQMAA